MKISFYNEYSYGDIIFTRGIANWIAEHIPSGHPLFYYHTKELKSVPMHKKIIEMKYNIGVDIKLYGLGGSQRNIRQCDIVGGEMFINMIVFCSPAVIQKNNGDIFSPKFMNTDTVKLKAQEIISFINKNLRINIPYPEAIDLLPNRVQISKNKTKIDDFFSNNKFEKTFLICNGETLSGQAVNFNLQEIMNPMFLKHPNILFLFSEKIKDLSEQNVAFVNDFCENNTIGDIEYMSKYADILIGRSSGPSHTFFNKENCYEEAKIIVELTNDIDRAFFHKQGNAKYFWSGSDKQEELLSFFETLLV